MALTRTRPMPRAKNDSSPAYAWLGMLLCLVMTVSGWLWAREHYDHHGQADIDVEAAKFVSGLRQSLVAYEGVMRSGAALVTARPDLSNDDWLSFVDATGLAKRCPGFQGVALLSVAHSAESDVTAERTPDLRVSLSQPTDWLRHQDLVAAHNDPLSANSAALARARDTGEMTKSAKTNFTLPTLGTVPGFLIYLPVYHKPVRPSSVAQRRQALAGFIVMPFRMAGFVTGVVQRHYEDIHSVVRVQVFDGSSTNEADELFDSASVDHIRSVPSKFATVVPFQQFGRQWTLKFSSLPAFESGRHPWWPWIFLACGLSLSLLAFAALEQTRRRQEATRRNVVALKDELLHRVKNTLAVVQSIANRSLSDDHSIREGRELFSSRLEALARSHTLIVENAWLGTALGELVRSELAPLAPRATTSGPPVSLSPQVAQALSLALHELAIDSVKRGVDSLDVTWRVDGAAGEPVAAVSWTEFGLNRAPSRSNVAQCIALHGFAVTPIATAAPNCSQYVFRVPLDLPVKEPEDG